MKTTCTKCNAEFQSKLSVTGFKICKNCCKEILEKEKKIVSYSELTEKRWNKKGLRII